MCEMSKKQPVLHLLVSKLFQGCIFGRDPLDFRGFFCLLFWPLTSERRGSFFKKSIQSPQRRSTTALEEGVQTAVHAKIHSLGGARQSEYPLIKNKQTNNRMEEEDITVLHLENLKVYALWTIIIGGRKSRNGLRNHRTTTSQLLNYLT